jgi:hypothetical protein
MEENNHGTTGGLYGTHLEVAASFLTACQNLKTWLVSSDLKREQIVAISSNESGTVDGDAVLSVIYRRANDPSMGSLKDVQYHLITSVQEWDEQYATALASLNAARNDILAITYTPRNLGQINIQVIWYLPAKASEPFTGYTYKRFSSKNDYQGALDEARAYLNDWVAPHQLVSVAAFEDDHPNTIKQLFHVVVLQRGPGDRGNASHSSEPIVGGIYNIDLLLEENGWEHLLHKAAAKCEDRDKATASTFNWSTDGGERQGAIVVGWSKTHEDMLVDSDRGGCTCAIF